MKTQTSEARAGGAAIPLCTICGEKKSVGQTWFLVAESHWEDKLKILQWKDDLADRRGLHRACCPAHVNELVVHWMASGNLDYLLAHSEVTPHKPARGSGLPFVPEPDVQGGIQIGELTVDRESVGRALQENPDSLQIILDELSDVLLRESTSATSRLESGAGITTGWVRQM